MDESSSFSPLNIIAAKSGLRRERKLGLSIILLWRRKRKSASGVHAGMYPAHRDPSLSLSFGEE